MGSALLHRLPRPCLPAFANRSCSNTILVGLLSWFDLGNFQFLLFHLFLFFWAFFFLFFFLFLPPVGRIVGVS